MKHLTIALLALACNANAEPIAVVPIRGGEVTLTDTPCSGEAGQQANVRVLGEALEVMECNDPRQPMLGRMRAALGNAPATLPLEIAGSLLPDDYVSPRLAAEAYRENEPDDQTCGACGGIHDTLTPCDQVAAQQNREKGQ